MFCVVKSAVVFYSVPVSDAEEVTTFALDTFRDFDLSAALKALTFILLLNVETLFGFFDVLLLV